MPKFIFVVGGVMSGIGKGITTASIGKILESKGYNVTAIKIDPYINIDAGTMNPTEHGEVFVLDDGYETDQDMGNYERFLNKDISSLNYMTTGRIYQAVIEKERNMEYGGKCVEVVPHIPEEVIYRIKKVATETKSDFVLIEIGGTVGEYQNMLFLEAARMLRLQNPKNVLFVLVSYLPIPKKIGEMKSKPTQQAVRLLNSAGIQPDFIIARSDVPIDEPRKQKLSVFCNIALNDVISAPDVDSIYEVPLNFEKDNIAKRILKKFGMRCKKEDLQEWEKIVNVIKKPKKEVKIGIVGKYFNTGKFTFSDSYISVIEAIKHACWYFKAKPIIQWINSEEYEKNSVKLKELKELQGVIIPGGFGSRGIEGKIKTIEYLRENKIPFLGLCYGMQLAVIEFARNICGLVDASSTEINPKTSNPIIDVMLEQKTNLKENKYGGTMRLGAYECSLIDKTISKKAYKKETISERHRHRYEFNNKYRDLLIEKGLVVAGINKERDLVEIIELPDHPFFVATQFHPEFKSRPLDPHPLFKEFIKVSLNRQIE